MSVKESEIWWYRLSRVKLVVAYHSKGENVFDINETDHEK